MGLFSKEKIAEQVFVKGKKLKCPICGNEMFYHREAQLNTKAFSMMNIDWANKSANCYVCSNCSNIQWFLEKV
ncbi:MAG: hypothetical protein KAH72_02575 [Flavobacteriaceae bacterium]|nr:hypothetical protein [Flavobacteriaceae bacterium]